MAILIDFSQIALSNIFADKEFQEAAKNPSEDSKTFLKHMILNTIRSYKTKYEPKYGQLVICADGKNSWRKQAFPLYKAARKKSRDASPVDWKFVFEVMSETLTDLKESFPFPVVHIDSAEGDDVIGVLTDWITVNRTQTVGLFEETEKIVVISSDGDFKQLQVRKNVNQWSPMQKKAVVSSNAKLELLEKILTGDAGDGIPNICSPDDVFVTEGARQKPFSKKRIDDFVKNGIDACKDDFEKRNFQRNELLISFDKIPERVYNSIVEEFKTQCSKEFKKMDLMNYFLKNRMKLMIEVMDDFV
jgi:hypothetical protein